ncbi:MAG TPA: hypothetical protein DGG94_02845 [Micromonosporaceae bacterium]|nr:hypothetical protein [Micromonosporaceae bacterium]HCU48757.1 hypothetical protein [Micromonosporaceae bacterium]
MQLTAAEQRLWDRFAAGEEVRLGDGDPLADDFDPQSWGEERTVRAEVIAQLMLGAVDQVPGQSARVYLTGARIIGQLNLNGATISQELTIINSYFDTTPDLGSVQARSVWLDSCRLPGFGGWSMEISNTLALINCRLDDLQLRSTRVGLDLELTGLRVGATGLGWALDGSGLVVAGGLRADGLVATGGINLTGARVGPLLDLTRGSIEVSGDSPALTATGLVVEGLLNASELKSNGMVDLIGVSVGGALMLSDARICLPQSTDNGPVQALSLEQARIGQHLLAPGIHLDGQLNMLGTKVEGALELRAATLHSPGAMACYADQLQAGRFNGDEMIVDGQMSLIGASFGRSVTFDRARFTFPDGIALDAMQISVAHNLELTEIRAIGGVSVYSGEIGGDVVVTGVIRELGAIEPGPLAHLTSALPIAAFDGRQLKVAKSIVFSEVTVQGQVSLESATVGDIAFYVTSFVGEPGNDALVFDDCTVQRDIRITALNVNGEFSAAGLQVGSDLKLVDATVTGGFRLENSTVRGDTTLHRLEVVYLTLANLTVSGTTVAITDSKVHDLLSLADVTGAGTVLLTGTEVSGIVVAGGMVTKRFRPTPKVGSVLNLSRATIAELSLNVSEWPPNVEVDGLRYEELTHEHGWRPWLERNSRLSFRMQPYTYLANYFRSSGHDDQARKVMLAAQRAQRRTRPWPLRVPGWIMDAFAGYGYAPGRALTVLIGAWAFGWYHYRDALLSADLVLPTSPFGLEADHPGGEGWVAIALIAIGWALSIAVLPAVTRSLGRN